MNRDEALRRSDLNLGAYIRHAISSAPGGAFEERDGLLLFAGPHPNPLPYVNGALRLDATLSAEQVLERARAFFTPRRRSFALWVRDHADADIEALAQASGFWQRPPVEGQPGIFSERLPGPPEVHGAELVRVSTERQASDYLACVGEAWGMADSPPELVAAMFLTPRAVLVPEAAAFVAYVDGMPGAGCMTYVSHEVAGMYWAGTTAAGKGRGLGAACFVAAMDAGFAIGARMASGQSSSKGTPIWVDLGFEVITHYRRYLVTPPRPS